MPPSSTTSVATPPTYRVRTMAGDIEALKKGTVPVHTPITIAPPPKSPVADTPETPKTPLGLPVVPATKNQTLPTKFTFPKLPTLEPAVNPLPKKEQIKPSSEPLRPPQPLSRMSPQPFSTPLAKPMTPIREPQMQIPTAPPPPTLPTAPMPPPIPPRPLTPRPVPPIPPPPLPTQISPPPRVPPPTLPPLPPLPKAAATLTGRIPSSKRRLILVAILAIIILTFIVGEIWWFFLRKEPLPQVTQPAEELLPPPQELQPLLPQETTLAITEPELPTALLAYDRTETIVPESSTPADMAAAIKNFDMVSVSSDELVRLAVKITAETSASGNKQSPESKPTWASLADIAAALKLKIPQNIKGPLASGFDLFVFGGNTFDKDECAKSIAPAPSCYGSRLGLVSKISDPAKMNPALKHWEKTMVSDLKPLVLARTGPAASTIFQTGAYQGQTIRYQNLPLNTITVEYAIVDDVLIITTSKSAMLKAIDSIPQAEEQK